MNFCSACGKENDMNNNFCRYCGYKINRQNLEMNIENESIEIRLLKKLNKINAILYFIYLGVWFFIVLISFLKGGL